MEGIVHVILKGHLLLEESLTLILEQYVFHREHLNEARLSFNQKLLLARSLCLRKNKLGEWELLSAINSLRNELTHRLNSPEREKKVTRVKDLYFREAAGCGDIEQIKVKSDMVIIVYACAHCGGFLASFEGDSKAFRRWIHRTDRRLNPDQPAFDL